MGTILNLFLFFTFFLRRQKSFIWLNIGPYKITKVLPVYAVLDLLLGEFRLYNDECFKYILVFYSAWLEERERSKLRLKEASLVKTIIRVFWKEFIQIMVLHSFNEFLIS